MNFKENLAVALMVLMLIGCVPAAAPDSNKPAASMSGSNKRIVFAVAYPLQYLTQRIVGESVNVKYLVPANERATHWRPQRDEILAMQAADLIVANGTGAKVARWLDSVALPESKICNSASRGLSLSDYVAVESLVHSHGPEGQHSHSATVPFSWLDPAIAAKQSTYIAKELTRIFPERAEEFERNLVALKKDLAELSASITALTNANNNSDSRPVLLTANYELKFLTRAAGWDDQHLDWLEPPDVETATAELTERLKQPHAGSTLTKNGQTVLLWSYPCPPELRSVCESLRVSVVELDPLDRAPVAGDYLAVMKKNIEALKGLKPTADHATD